MLVTNSELLTQITTLQSDIYDQQNLCKNLLRFTDPPANDIKDLIDDTLSKIEKLKNYQKIISLRNANYFYTLSNSTKLSVADIIKLKEELVLKKNILSIISNASHQADELVPISLSYFSEFQNIKNQLSEIQNILTDFNNKQFKTEDYQ